MVADCSQFQSCPSKPCGFDGLPWWHCEHPLHLEVEVIFTSSKSMGTHACLSSLLTGGISSGLMPSSGITVTMCHPPYMAAGRMQCLKEKLLSEVSLPRKISQECPRIVGGNMAFTECLIDVSILSVVIFKWIFSLIYVKTCVFPLALNLILLVEF